MKQNLLQEIIDAVKDLVGHEYLYFDKAVSVRRNEFSYPFNAWALCTGPDGKLYVMDSDEQWFPVEDRPGDEQLIVALRKKVFSLPQVKERRIA
jgi:hypothetical protein